MYIRQLKLPKSRSFFLFGPRQSGKSTLIRETFHAPYTTSYNLLHGETYLRLKQSPNLLRKEIEQRATSTTHIVIDEIQRIPELLNEVHDLLESKNPPVFVLSGSSARKLRRGNANLLAGRAWTFSLFPLTAEEMGSKFELASALRFGTLPSIVTEPDDQSRERSLKSYIENYIKEEIEQEALVRNSGAFLRFLTIAADSDGKLLNFSAIARDVNSTPQTTREYFKILEDTLLGRMLYPFHNSERKRLSTHPKFYLFDLGVQRAILKRLSAPPLEGTYEYGRLFENWVINQAFTFASYHEKEYRFSFFRNDNDVEVDLIIENSLGQTAAIEIKSSTAPASEEITRGFATFQKIKSKIHKICVCRTPRIYEEGGITMLPFQQFNSWLESF